MTNTDCNHDNDDEVKIKKLTIEFERTNHFDIEGCEYGGDWCYIESLKIDREKEQLVLKQIIGTDCRVTHQYDVQGGMNSLLSTAEDCFNSEEWIDTTKFDDKTGIRFYNLTAEYDDGRKISHSGVYNRRNIPEEPWSKLIDLIRDFISFYGFGELLNKNAFMNARKDGEVKYCSVSFDDSDRTFYYKTNDERIKIGDYVNVPFGKENTVREGYVENIEYFQIDEVPFPLEKTKQIIKKV